MKNAKKMTLTPFLLALSLVVYPVYAQELTAQEMVKRVKILCKERPTGC